MSDKLRGALFNSLGNINGLTLLDAFAGSGAIGFEAISRGAKQVDAVDQDIQAYSAIKKNIAALGFEGRVKPIRASVSNWSNRNTGKLYDLVIVDPPYDDIRRDHLQKIAYHTQLNGVLVLSLPPKVDFKLPAEFEPLSSKNHGDALLVFYRRTG
jgi:16S rRNA (guanine966-N2)-methyltransferase